MALTLRYAMSAVMHVAVVGYVARLMWVGGVWDIARSFLDAKFAAPCGAFPHQEYVVFSSNIVYGNSMAGGGFHVRGGMIGGTHLVRGSNRAGFNKTRILSMIASNRPDIAILDFGDSVVGPGAYKLFRMGAKGAGTLRSSPCILQLISPRSHDNHHRKALLTP